MDMISKIYKVKIGSTILTITIDNSYIAEKGNRHIKAQSPGKASHYHALCELFVIGDMPLSLCVSDHSTSYKNCALFVPPFASHYAIRQADYRILFSCRQDASAQDAFSRFIGNVLSRTTPTSLACNATIRLYAEELKHCFFEKNDLSDEMIPHILKLMFYSLYRSNTPAPTHDAKTANDSYLVKIEHIIFCAEGNITLKTVADTLGLSTKQTSRIIRKNYNATLSEMIAKRRLQEACTLLTDTTLTIADIAEQVHFSSESYFFSQFKKQFGCTPLKYRKTHQNKAKDTPAASKSF